LKIDQRILGIDPGSRKTGFGVIDLIGGQLKYITSGVIKSTDGDFTDRLKVIHQSVRALIKEYNPHIMSIESVFVHKNPSSALKLGHARAAALCATFDFDMDVFEYSPREIKKGVVGTGAASKEQVQHMVVSLLNLGGSPAEDAADAIAAAICYSNEKAMRDALRITS
jgi:crossover junction endodeoxyribonuclease RuvC|tara:strand:- start:11398 stop:11901 length:504 start_codon:yes stop_codon:yes gene_type:complete